MVLLSSMMSGLKKRYELAKDLPLRGDSICSQYPKKIKKQCNSLIARHRYDPVVANLCIARGSEVDFECLLQVSNAQFQLDMLSFCAGESNRYLSLCLLALRNKTFTESERSFCEQAKESPDKVYCLAHSGRHKT